MSLIHFVWQLGLLRKEARDHKHPLKPRMEALCVQAQEQVRLAGNGTASSDLGPRNVEDGMWLAAAR
ncbi:MAG: hypothetical protein Q9190_002984 [Brigantiaea leucoxantha]